MCVQYGLDIYRCLYFVLDGPFETQGVGDKWLTVSEKGKCIPWRHQDVRGKGVAQKHNKYPHVKKYGGKDILSKTLKYD